MPLDEFAAASTQALASIDASASLTREDDQYILTVTRSADADLSSLAMGGVNLELAEAAVDVGATFTFPGLVTEASAGDIDGHTVTLGLADLATTPEIRIVADAAPAIDWGPILLVGGIALSLIAIVGGAAWLIVDDRRRARRTSLPAPTTTAAPSGPGMLGDADPER
ncbi:LppM family (lipo)protein [Demequina litorisediminis]|uniref:LppM family (lipo)protein n=1 Tax=Demequina litorisediminis TaxID=1849022 RepID=UPI003D67FA08